jgi:DNA-binding LacI/PurR family transcriptional regulator
VEERGSSNGQVGVQTRARRVTLRDVAATAGLSVGTASNALNGSPLVRPETRARVLEAAQRLEYVPDRNAARLRHGRSECIAVAFSGRCPAVADATFDALLVRGITQVLEEHGYTMRLVGLDDATAPAAPRKGRRRPLTAQEVDGVIVVNWQDPARMARLREVGVPLVAVDTSGAHPDLPSVDNDDRGGVASGVAYLIKLGHRRIALLNDALSSPFGREALAGYLQACEQHRLAVEPWLLRTSDFTVAGGRKAMAEILAGDRVPTAVFAVDDETAVGAMQAIHEAGLSVPADVSVVGMDDIPLAAAVSPALTTVRIDVEELGRRATEHLMEIIDGANPKLGRAVLPTRLVVRDSAAIWSTTPRRSGSR